MHQHSLGIQGHGGESNLRVMDKSSTFAIGR